MSCAQSKDSSSRQQCPIQCRYLRMFIGVLYLAEHSMCPLFWPRPRARDRGHPLGGSKRFPCVLRRGQIGMTFCVRTVSEITYAAREPMYSLLRVSMSGSLFHSYMGYRWEFLRSSQNPSWSTHAYPSGMVAYRFETSTRHDKVNNTVYCT